MSVVARLTVHAETETKNLLNSLESRLLTWNLSSHYENLANLAELSLELSRFTPKSTDEIFKILSTVPLSELKTEIFRLIHLRGPPTLNSKPKI
jgi:hypothetical protein